MAGNVRVYKGLEVKDWATSRWTSTKRNFYEEIEYYFQESKHWDVLAYLVHLPREPKSWQWRVYLGWGKLLKWGDACNKAEAEFNLYTAMILELDHLPEAVAWAQRRLERVEGPPFKSYDEEREADCQKLLKQFLDVPRLNEKKEEKK